jgi:hypothetical protein
MTAFHAFIAIPILAEFVTRGRIHSRDQLERIERLAAGIHLLENKIYLPEAAI